MRKYNDFNRLLSFILAMVLAVGTLMQILPMQIYAEKGDVQNAEAGTGLTGNIDTGDTISLPVKIMDYQADGMLFEFAESVAFKSSASFGSTWGESYVGYTSVKGTINDAYYYWYDYTLALKTGTYANYLRATWAGNSTAAWTGGRAATVLADFGENSNYTTNLIRFMVIIFRSNDRTAKFNVGVNRVNRGGAGTEGNYTNTYSVTTKDDNTWTAAVLDLKNGTLADYWDGNAATYGKVLGVYVGLPMDGSGDWMDIANVAFFATESSAEKFADYALTDGNDRGDNRAFGLLRGSRDETERSYYNSAEQGTSTVDLTEWVGAYTDINSTVSAWDSASYSYIDKPILGGQLDYKLLGDFRGIATVGLLDSTLGADGLPVYKEEVVTYLAKLLQATLTIPEYDSTTGWKNYRYVEGEPSELYGGVDFATALRSRITGGLGTYAASAAKTLKGTWAEVSGNISTYHDAAYFMLNSIFIPGSYNELQDDYNYLVLSGATDSTSGLATHVFDAGFVDTASPTSSTSAAIKYDTTNKTIQNTAAVGKAQFSYEYIQGVDGVYYDNWTTLTPFLPVTDDNNATGMTKSPYYQDDGVLSTASFGDTLVNRDYNYVLSSSGEFIYHADDELFFEFEGDDDVYLFINGELVLDLGGAHGIDGYRFELNDYVAAAKAGTLGDTARNNALNLQEGGTYSFNFFYMERHSYGSNMRINTNIHVTDPAMKVEKNAYQEGYELDYGGIINGDSLVEYGFAISNSGNTRLFDLTFSDSDIGVTLDPTNGLKVTGSNVFDMNGGTLEATDLVAYINGYSDWESALANNVAPSSPTATVTVTFADNEALKAFLTDLTANGTDSVTKGLWPYATVEIRGIGYKLTDAQKTVGRFANTVRTSCTDNLERTLYGSAEMLVHIPDGPMYYQWAGHMIHLDSAHLANQIKVLANTEDNSLYNTTLANKITSNASITKLELTTRSGYATTSEYVTVGYSAAERYYVDINYKAPGAYVFYLAATISGIEKPVIVSMRVYVFDVVDSVYVLDYGLQADLLGDGLTAGDALTTIGRNTESGLMAIGSDGSYASNKISFNTASYNTHFTFHQADQYLSYKRTDGSFLEGLDTVQLALNVYESGITPSALGSVDITQEVQMYKDVTVVPANVVYYEDDFPAITYSKEPTFQAVTSGDLIQSDDQQQEYGRDDAYKGSEDDEFSAESYHKFSITDDEVIMSFDFTGTGFELVSRTQSAGTCTIIVQVLDSAGGVVKYFPVISEFDNAATGDGDYIYQVPVIRVNDLEKGTYTVKISGIPAWDFSAEPDENGEYPILPSYLYVDGLRIFQPLGQSSGYYNSAENGATFAEIRDMVANGFAAVTKLNGSGNLSFNTGTITWTENLNGTQGDGTTSYIGHKTDSINDYLLMGPNNEVYLNGDSTQNVLLFYFKKVEGAATNSLQIALRGIDKGLFFGSDSLGNEAAVWYGGWENTDTEEGYSRFAWYPLVTIQSQAEQYYSIDLTNCPVDSEGRIQVAIKVSSGMASLSSLKYNGLTPVAVDCADASTVYYDNGVLTDMQTSEPVAVSEFPNFQMVTAQLNATAIGGEYVQSQPTLSLSHPTLSLEDEIKYNVYFTGENLDNVVQMGLMTFASELADGTRADALEIIPGYVTGEDCYMVSTNGIPAKNMGDTVFFKVYALLSDGSYVYSDISGYNAKAYAGAVLASDCDDSLKALVVAMMNYGAKAQQFFGYNTGSLMNSSLTAGQRALVSAYDSAMTDAIMAPDSAKTAAFVQNQEGFAELKPTVSLEGALAINYYFTTAFEPDGLVTMYYWTAGDYANAALLSSTNATATVVMKQTGTENQFWGAATGIAAKDMGQTVYAVGVYEYNGVTYTTGVLAYHVGAYFGSIAAANIGASDLAAAAAVYGYYAQQYFG